MTHVLDPFEVMESLGEGGYATVRKAKYKGIDEYLFAMKSMRKEVDGIDMVPSIKNELNLLNKIDHPNIANFNECYEDETHFHAILEFSPGESLAQMLCDRKTRLPTIDILKIFYQIFNTAAYLKRMKIIHRDYKPPNIMVFKTENYKYLGYQIQLVDFGFARTFQDSLHDQVVMGSPHYVAPESLMHNYSYSSDVWSIGIMLYYVLALEYPFEDSDTSELFRKIKEQSLKLEPEDAWKDVSDDFKDLIRQMLEKDPNKRIKIEDIPIHPVFK